MYCRHTARCSAENRGGPPRARPESRKSRPRKDPRAQGFSKLLPLGLAQDPREVGDQVPTWSLAMAKVEAHGQAAEVISLAEVRLKQLVQRSFAHGILNAYELVDAPPEERTDVAA